MRMLLTFSIISIVVYKAHSSTLDQDIGSVDLNVIQNEILELKAQENEHYKDIKNEIRLLRDEISGGEEGFENGTWTQWSACSRDCGTGTQKRSRSRQSVVDQELQYCNLQPCQQSGQPCLWNVRYCGHLGRSATCQNGTCICSEKGYNRYTCLPEFGSCMIQIDPKVAIGQKSKNTSISGGYRLHSCTANDNTRYEVHIIGIYGDRVNRDMRIRLIPKDEVKKPIIVVLTSYESTNWVVESPVPIQKVIHGGYSTSTVSVSNNSVVTIEHDAALQYSYGSSSDKTLENLRRISVLYGPISSFTGYYELDPPSPTIEILVGGNPLEAKTEILPVLPSTPTTSIITSPAPVTDAGICDAGYFTQFSLCIQCAIGTFQPNKGQTACIPCPADTTTATAGAISQLECNVGIGSWGPWGPCSRSCDIGTQTRYRTANGTTKSEIQYCNLNNCADSALSNCSGRGPAACWHFTTLASCINGKCICTRSNYNNYTCLPEVGNCIIRANPPTALGRASNDTRRSPTLYSCTTNDNRNYEVHVVGIYGDRTDNVMNVRLIERAIVSKPVILILTSYEPTHWKIKSSTRIQKLIMTYFRSEGSLVYNSSMVNTVETNRSRNFGFGSDGGGGRTVDMLNAIYSKYGPITSFTGYYSLRSPPTPTIEIFVGGNSLASLSEVPPVTTRSPPTTMDRVRTTTTEVTTGFSGAEWSSWGDCSRPCDIGTQKRTRYRGVTQQYELQYCNLQSCTETPQGRCSGSSRANCWHFHSMATCVDGECICTTPYLNNYTCSPEIGNCVLRENPPTAIGKATADTRLYGGYKLWSCTTNDNRNHDVHVVGMYGDRRNNVVNVRLVERAPVSKPIILILASYEATHWKIKTNTKIKQLVMSYYTSGGSLDFNASMVLNAQNTRDLKYGYGSNRATGQMLSKIYEKYGPVTSFTGYYELGFPPTPTIEILVGGNPLSAMEAIPTLPPTLPPTTTTTTTPSTTTFKVRSLSAEGRACLENRTCWLKYKFNYDKIWTACFGDQYVRKTGLSVGVYVGVVLCNEQGSRYKLFMSDDLNSMFLNIADSNGHGQDHCELVGGDVNNAKLPNDFWDSPSATGYYRSNAGQQFQLGQIGFGPKDMSAWTGKYYCKWYECGVNIPGSNAVVLN